MIKLLFGKAGSGKSYIGRMASLHYGFYFYDADGDLPEGFRRAIQNEEKVSDEVREEYIEIVITKIKRLTLAHEAVCICQALVRNKYRERILRAIPSVEYVWVDALEDLITTRLGNRTSHVAPRRYAEMVNRIFEMPTVPHVRFENGNDPARFDEQMRLIFGRKIQASTVFPDRKSKF